MGVTPSNLGKLADVNLIGLNTNLTSTSSTKNDVANTCIGLATSIGGLLLAGMVSRKSAEGAGDGGQNKTDATTQQTQLQQLENQLTLEQAKLDAYEDNLVALKNTIEDLTQKTNETDIKQKEENVNKLKNELYGKDAKHKELANQITQANDKCTSTSQTLADATNTYSSLSRELSSMQGKRANIEALTKSENKDEAKSASDRLSSLDAEIAQKQTEVDQAKLKMEEAQKANQLAEDQRNNLKAKDEQAFIEVQSKIEEYNSANADLTSIKNSLETNKKLLKEACDNKAKLETELSTQKSTVQNLEDKILEEKGKNLRETSDAAADYTAADQKDGNWLSRTWQKTKGIFSKSARAEYKLMKQAHEQKNAAGDKLEALGADPSQFSQKSVQKAERQEEAEQKTRNLINSFSTNPTATRALNSLSNKITAYFMSNPDKTIEDAMKEFGIQENGEPKPETQ